MPNLNEIRNRISGVKSTQKITSAMYLISSAKMRKAKEAFDRTKPFFEAQRTEIKRIFENSPSFDSRFFVPLSGHRETENRAYLVITADKGLAGAYNLNVIRAAEAAREKYGNIKLYVVGEVGIRYFKNHRIPIECEIHSISQTPSYRWAVQISSRLMEDYLGGRIDDIYMLYNDVQSELACAVTENKLLPFEREEFLPREKWGMDRNYAFDPSPVAVLDGFMPQYVAGNIYGALVDSFCAEQNARMTAMSAANDNAEALLAELKIEFNRIRQGAITQEITEVAAGARAQKRKKKKKRAVK
ncbi:MAG: ATP synthase F1 subunit gamma [Lachnospiraceae bacterium]|nr:ATP synthase F1 subunit gamma [Lachnospiraceae bacterium]